MKKLEELQKRFEEIKSKKERAHGALRQAVETLKKEYGVENAEAAKKVVDGYDKNVKRWTKERADLVEEIDKALKTCDVDTGEEDDFDDFDSE